MRTALSLLALTFTLAACSSNDAPFAPGGRVGALACTQMGAISGLEIMYSQAQALTPQVAVVINDDPTLTVDSCKAQGAITIHSSGTQLLIAINLDQSQTLSSTYFSSNRAAEPIKNDISYKVYGHANCDDPLVLIADRQSIQIPWKPLYPNGISCGADGYMAQITDSSP